MVMREEIEEGSALESAYIAVNYFFHTMDHADLIEYVMDGMTEDQIEAMAYRFKHDEEE